MAADWKGQDTTRPPVFIGYDQTERMVAALMDRAAAWRPDAVVAITRGGLIPGTMAAGFLALPLAMVAWDRATATLAWLGPRPEGRLLVVDDSASTGSTLRGVLAALAPQPALSLTIVHDPEVTGYAPDLSHPMTTLFRLPWERGEATPSARANRRPGQPAAREHEARFTGIDLDGIFLPDIPLAAYEADLHAAIQARHALPPHPTLPPFDPARAVIITGRPVADEHLTKAWLAQHGHDLPVQSRPADVGHDLASITKYKADAATRWGCTHYIESEPEQAIRIAAHAPHLVVSWWSPAEARAWVIGAA